MKLLDLEALEILDSRGNPTLKVMARTEHNWATFSVPSGASTGVHEALELRDGGKAFGGKGVQKAIANVEGEIKSALLGLNITDQKAIDEALVKLDGTENKGRLGANAILGVSGAIVRLAAKEVGLPLYQYLQNIFANKGIYNKNYLPEKYKIPDLYMNIINGGAHATNNIDIQETMIVPQAKSLAEKVRIGSEVYQNLKEVLKSKKLAVALGDEGGFAPDLESNTKALDVVIDAIQKAGYQAGKDVLLALDIAASEIYDETKDQKYILASENVGLSSTQICSWYKELIATYPIVSIEDGLAEDDWEGWKAMTERIGKNVQLVGDDLFVTNPARIQAGITQKVANAVLIKVNQIGTITETLEAIKLAQSHKYNCMISHRSGETEDTFIADLVVATGVGQIKSGAPARGERTAKYNRLIEIEKEINRKG